MGIRIRNNTHAVFAVPGVVNQVFQPEETKVLPYIEWDEVINNETIKKAIDRGFLVVDNLDPVPVSGDGIYGGSGTLLINTSVAMGANDLQFNATTSTGLLTVRGSSGLVGINDAAPQAHLDINGSVAKSIATITANRTIGNANSGDGDYTLLVDATSGNRTINLPAASNNTGRILIIKVIATNGGVNSVTVDGFGAETIDGVLTWSTMTQWDSITIQCNGTGWFII